MLKSKKRGFEIQAKKDFGIHTISTFDLFGDATDRDMLLTEAATICDFMIYRMVVVLGIQKLKEQSLPKIDLSSTKVKIF